MPFLDYPSINLSRFIAAIAIVFFHYAQDLFPFHEMIPFVSKWNTAVSYFFILSGFIMVTSNYAKGEVSAKIYYQNRLLRIYPLYLTAALLILIYIVFSINTLDITGFFLNLFMLQAWVPSKALSFNYPAWSLSVELLFYLLFPFLFNKLYRRYALPKIAVGIILFWLSSQLLIHLLKFSGFYNGPQSDSGHFILFFPIFHLNEFLVGNLLGLFCMQKTFIKRNNTFILIGIIIVYVLILTLNKKLLLNNGILALIYIPLLYFLISDNGYLSRLSSHKMVAFLGEISYGIYILQFPIFLWMTSIFKKLAIENRYLLFYSSLSVLIIFSALCFKYIEQRVRKYKL